MANPEYTRTREMALRANTIGPSACVGDGKCCTPDIPLTKGDLAVIVKNVRRSNIPREVVRETIERSNDLNRQDKCAFLDPDNKCSIYPYRPVTCIVWGIGGLPMDKPDYYKAKREWEKSGTPDEYPNVTLEQFTCLGCRFMTAFDATKIEANELAMKASEANTNTLKKKNGEPYALMDYVKTELPYELQR